MSLLEYKNKFNINNSKRARSIGKVDPGTVPIEKGIFVKNKWSNSNFYRTSYNDMRSKVSDI